MNILLENFNMALTSLWGNRLRAILTMLGIIIGVAAVVLIVALGQSVQTGIQSELGALQVDQISVSVFPDESGRYRPLRMQDVRYITEQLAPISTFRVMPQRRLSSAASIVSAAICCAVGSGFTSGSAMKRVR